MCVCVCLFFVPLPPQSRLSPVMWLAGWTQQITGQVTVWSLGKNWFSLPKHPLIVALPLGWDLLKFPPSTWSHRLVLSFAAHAQAAMLLRLHVCCFLVIFRRHCLAGPSKIFLLLLRFALVWDFVYVYLFPVIWPSFWYTDVTKWCNIVFTFQSFLPVQERLFYFPKLHILLLLPLSQGWGWNQSFSHMSRMRHRLTYWTISPAPS